MADARDLQSRPSPHALVFSYSDQGHITPMMLLAKTLASRGVQITFVLTEHYLSTISRLMEESKSKSSFLGDVRLVGIPDGLPADHDRDPLDPTALTVNDNMGGALEGLLRDMQSKEQHVTCVIGDYFARCVRDVARKLKIPTIVFWPQSATALALFSHSNDIISSGFDPFDASVQTLRPNQPVDLITCVPGVPPIHPAYLPFGASTGVSCLQWIKTLIADQQPALDEAIWVIGNSFQRLEPLVCSALDKFQAIGPLLPLAFHPVKNSQDLGSGVSLWREEDCMEWLDRQPDSSVLYVSFGSTGRFPISQIREIAYGLLASRQRFLWVIHTDALREKGMTNILDALPEGFLDQIEEKGKIVNWAPQYQVLAHPSVSGFFSHCGWNSVMDSIGLGVPLLGWPQIVDQVTNCWLIVHEWKIGLELERDEKNETDRKHVDNGVRLLMSGQAAEQMNARLAILTEAAREANEARGSSSVKLDLLVDDLSRLSLRSSLVQNSESRTEHIGGMNEGSVGGPSQ